VCATPRLERKKVLGALSGDEAVHTAFAQAAIGHPAAVAALLAVVAKKALAVDGAAAAGEANALKECSPATAVVNTLKAPVAR
jgi:hypothetical protein